jgi:hypothetical protein
MGAILPGPEFLSYPEHPAATVVADAAQITAVLTAATRGG